MLEKLRNAAFISRALTRVVDEATVCEWVGHVDKDTMKRYTHISKRDSHAEMLCLEQSVRKHRRTSSFDRLFSTFLAPR